jgi:hypothetical protein
MGQAMIDCEIQFDDGNSFNARFAVLPRITERVILPDHGRFVVKNVLHFDLWGRESTAPAVMLSVVPLRDDD